MLDRQADARRQAADRRRRQQRREQQRRHRERQRRYRHRQRASALMVVVEIGPEHTAKLVQLGFLRECALEDRAAIAAAVRQALDAIEA
jgi:hypothetical protein